MARAGVAVSSAATGPFKFLRSFRPNGRQSRDLNLFKVTPASSQLRCRPLSECCADMLCCVPCQTSCCNRIKCGSAVRPAWSDPHAEEALQSGGHVLSAQLARRMHAAVGWHPKRFIWLGALCCGSALAVMSSVATSKDYYAERSSLLLVARKTRVVKRAHNMCRTMTERRMSSIPARAIRTCTSPSCRRTTLTLSRST